jgi:hypothetical protein
VSAEAMRACRARSADVRDRDRRRSQARRRALAKLARMFPAEYRKLYMAELALDWAARNAADKG